jgi:DNA-binding transcriptional ArsR family regulator
MFKNMNMSRTQLELLMFLSGQPRRTWHVRELAKDMGISTGAASLGLRKLRSLGLARSEHRGNMVFYKLEDEKQLVRSFRLFLTLLELDPLVEDLKDSCERIILFGSAADGTEREGSDVDLLVVTIDKEGIDGRLRKYRTIKGLPLNAVVLTPGELLNLSRKNKAFHDRATGGLVIWRGGLE